MNTTERLKKILREYRGYSDHGAEISEPFAAAAIESEFVLIDTADLPEVAPGAGVHTYRAGGESVVYTSADNAKYWVLRDIAVWQHLAAREAEAAKAEAEDAKKLNHRRDELADELAPRISGLGKNWYRNVSQGMRAAIDRIIELESQK